MTRQTRVFALICVALLCSSDGIAGEAGTAETYSYIDIFSREPGAWSFSVNGGSPTKPGRGTYRIHHTGGAMHLCDSNSGYHCVVLEEPRDSVLLAVPIRWLRTGDEWEFEGSEFTVIDQLVDQHVLGRSVDALLIEHQFETGSKQYARRFLYSPLEGLLAFQNLESVPGTAVKRWRPIETYVLVGDCGLFAPASCGHE